MSSCPLLCPPSPTIHSLPFAFPYSPLFSTLSLLPADISGALRIQIGSLGSAVSSPSGPACSPADKVCGTFWVENHSPFIALLMLICTSLWGIRWFHPSLNPLLSWTNKCRSLLPSSPSSHGPCLSHCQWHDFWPVTWLVLANLMSLQHKTYTANVIYTYLHWYIH